MKISTWLCAFRCLETISNSFYFPFKVISNNYFSEKLLIFQKHCVLYKGSRFSKCFYNQKLSIARYQVRFYANNLVFWVITNRSCPSLTLLCKFRRRLNGNCRLTSHHQQTWSEWSIWVHSFLHGRPNVMSPSSCRQIAKRLQGWSSSGHFSVLLLHFNPIQETDFKKEWGFGIEFLRLYARLVVVLFTFPFWRNGNLAAMQVWLDRFSSV